MPNQETNKTPGREFALKFLFHLFIKENTKERDEFLNGELSAEALEEKLIDFKESYVQPDDEHPDNQIDDNNWFFANKLIKGIGQHMKDHEETLKKETNRKSLDQLEKIERSILLVGVEELRHFETPYQVVIHELVNLAKKYGGENSGRFVNGVLDGIRAKNS